MPLLRRPEHRGDGRDALAVAGDGETRLGDRARMAQSRAEDMTAGDRWDLVETLLHDALEREPSARAAFLANACPDDAVRHEVEALLRAHEQPGVLDALSNAVMRPLRASAERPAAGRVPRSSNGVAIPELE